MKKLIDYRLSHPFPEMMRFDVTQYDWYNTKLGGILPSKFSYQRDNLDTTELHIVLNYFFIDLFFDDGSIDRIISDKGTVWDLASVTGFLRSIVDNDSLIVFLAALFHDEAIGLHLFPVEMCNEIFRDIIIIFVDKYSKRYIEMQKIVSGNIEDDKKREKFDKKYMAFILEWAHDAKKQAGVYFFGVDVKVSPCYKIYEESEPATHWNKNFVKKVPV